MSKYYGKRSGTAAGVLVTLALFTLILIKAGIEYLMEYAIIDYLKYPQ